MEKRVLLAIFLCVLSLYLWQAFVVKPVPPKAPVAEAPAAEANVPASPTAIPSRPSDGAASASPAAVVTGDTTEKTIRVETKDVIAEFTNRGARLKSWRLKRYLDQAQGPQELVVNMPSQPLPFTLRVRDDTTTAALSDALFSTEGTDPLATHAPLSAPATLRFTYLDAAGLRVTKEFGLEPTGYIITFRGTVVQEDPASPGTKAVVPYSIAWGPAVGDISENSRYVKKAEGLIFQDGKVRRLTPKDVAGQPTVESDFRYVGVDDNYFMTAALFPGPSKVTYHPVSIPPPAGSKEPPRDLMAFTLETAPNDAPKKFFAGPKDLDVLAAIGPDVVKAIDFGIFAVIVVPLLSSLKWVNSYVGNYGWSIIILTIIINALMFPLRHKSNVSMRKMQQIQPEVKAIQERYAKLKATDPAKQKMNTEMMALYRERGVNPAGGCVPMLLTMPVLIALYALLSQAIELRGAPFFGWIHDLSLHDPLFITPVVMGATQFWQQRMQPAAGVDPAQQKMMMLMPIVFTAMFLWAPAGVAVYWLAGNLLGIGQQYLTNYLIGPPKIRGARPPAERRVKRAGG